MPEKKPDNEEKQTFYVCPHCEKAFKTKNALNGHLGVCKARPAEDEEYDEDTDGINLFPERKEEPAPRRQEVQDDEDGYQCGACGYVSGREFRYCPKCGEENDFE